jgi:hypothetical protein
MTMPTAASVIQLLGGIDRDEQQICEEPVVDWQGVGAEVDHIHQIVLDSSGDLDIRDAARSIVMFIGEQEGTDAYASNTERYGLRRLRPAAAADATAEVMLVGWRRIDQVPNKVRNRVWLLDTPFGARFSSPRVGRGSMVASDQAVEGCPAVAWCRRIRMLTRIGV